LVGVGYLLASFQGVLAVSAIAGLQFTPPPQGSMLLVSTTGQSQAAILRRTMPSGARLVGPGPLAASVVVYGERGAIAAAALPAGILVLDASGGLCGGDL
jgi:hypothetical protein